MLTTKSSPEKRIFDWQEQQQVNIEKEIVDFNVQLFFSLSLPFVSVSSSHQYNSYFLLRDIYIEYVSE
jgi:hypothetical protein